MRGRWTWLAGLVALTILALWQVPAWLDWTRYRSTIEVVAGERLGQPVRISGAVSLTLLPEPVLTAAQVNVGGDGPGGLAVHVDALRLRLAIGPLLAGRVAARELVLRGPDLRIPWPLPGTLTPHPPSWLASLAARIEDGRLSLGRLAFTDVDASLASLDTGALTASGTARFNGQTWRFASRLTAAGGDGASGLDVALEGEGKADGLAARFTGQLAADGTLAGGFSSRGPDLATLLPAPAKPFRAEGRLTAGGGLVAIDDLAVDVGGAPATAAVALRVAPQQRLDIALSASRLDLDAWLPVLLQDGTTVAGIDMPIGIDFSAEAAPLGNRTLEHLRAGFELRDQRLAVREASARLPGNATISLSGQLNRDPAHPSFEGDVRLNAPMSRVTLAWLQRAVPSVLPPSFAADRLPEGTVQSAEIAAEVAVGDGAITLRHIAGRLDDTRVSGDASYRPGEPRTLSADLAIDRLPLDPWLPDRLPRFGDAVSLAAGLQAELRLRIGQAGLAGATVRDVAVDAAIDARGIRLRRFESVANGAHIIASGTLSMDGRLSDARLMAETADASPIAGLLPRGRWTTGVPWRGPARLTVLANGPTKDLALQIRLAFADGRLEADPTLDLASGEWHGDLKLYHPRARRLLTAFGLPALSGIAASLGDQPLSLTAHMAGAPGRLDLDTFDLTAASLHTGGSLALDASGSEPWVRGRLHADALRLPMPNVWSGAPLPFAMLRGWRADLQLGIGRLTAFGADWRDVAAGLSLADGELRLEELTAALGSGSVAGNLTCDATSNPPSLTAGFVLKDAAITGPLTGASIDLLSGRASGSLDLTASGYSSATLLATASGRATLSVADGVMSGFDMARLRQAIGLADPKAAETAATDALRGGSGGFHHLDITATLADGELAVDSGALNGTDGDAGLTGRVNLMARTLDARLALQPSLDRPPYIALLLSGPLGHPNATPELADLARWMAELVH